MKFSDGTEMIVSAKEFIDGIINPSHKRLREERIGMYKRTVTGMGATLVDYKSKDNVLVRFDNGLTRTTSWATFENLDSTKFTSFKELYIGLERTMKDGTHCVIVDGSFR